MPGHPDNVVPSFTSLSIPNSKVLDWSKLKAFAEDKINVTEKKKNEICLGMGRKHCGKRRKSWLPVFSPFPTNIIIQGT